ncbi:MAG: hypothetical protein ACI82F_002691 [Planctomycetota bacterium]
MQHNVGEDVTDVSSRRRAGAGSAAMTFVVLFALLFLVGAAASEANHASVGRRFIQADSASCMACHEGIEDMHPEAFLSCVDCHGGDGTAASMARAHVPEPRNPQENERVAPEKKGLAWRRFQNPMDLRVAADVCGDCHQNDVDHLMASLHVSTAGHLSDGFYEMGLSEERGSRFSVFPVSRPPLQGGEVTRLEQIPGFDERGPRDELATHFTDLARKECMQCHLWSEGRAVTGRVGFDGDYRGEGCAACHVAYAIDGLSESEDATAQRNEPGHPRKHSMMRTAPTDTCVSCHYGDASIGLHFRGLSQLPPDAPGGPEIPGTTDRLINRVYYLNDPEICPPDVHYERGMHCVDCHTKGDVMGDGMLHGQMEYGVEISCEACHGSFDEASTLRTERGTPLENLHRDGERVVLTGKVTGLEHDVVQIVNVTDPDRPEYNRRAAAAMTSRHGNVECYTCHAGWNVNFLGFHFSRNESLTQLDLISGKRTSGRVSTQEKVFATWKSFYSGLNEQGRVAPYLTGFSTMGSVWDESGELIIDQAMPVTSEGLSGMTMIHHQLHSTRSTARQCAECHRAPSTWGLGSENFQLARQLAFVADRRGLEVVALDRRELGRSAALAKVVLPDIVALAAHCDPLQGFAHHIYAAEGGRGVHVIDVRNPTQPRLVHFVPTVDPQALFLTGDQLYIADGEGGVRILDVSKPEQARLVGHVATFDARDIDVRWPWAYVADGVGGLVILDVQAPLAPRVLSALDVNAGSERANETTSVATLFQYSRPMAQDGEPIDRRTQARNIACLIDRKLGLITVDITEPTRPHILWPLPDELSSAEGFGGVTYRGLSFSTQVDLAERQGGARTRERDYAYVQQERGVLSNRRSQVVLFDVSNPAKPVLREAVQQGYESEGLEVVDFYNPPFRQRMAFTPGERGLLFADVSTSSEPVALGGIPGLRQTYAVAFERFPLDRMIKEGGQRLKDVSHPDSRWLYRDEILRILQVDAALLPSSGRSRQTDRPERYPADEPLDVDIAHGGSVRQHLARSDRDGSGALEGDEVEAAKARTMDLDGDGRVTLLELVKAGGALGLEPAPDVRPPDPEPFVMERLDVDGDLARIFDRVNPWDFDRDGDGSLGARELQAAAFAALDLNADGGLSLGELSRYPGRLRSLRFGGDAATELFAEADRNQNGLVSSREFKLGDAEREALDGNGDGNVLLARTLFPFHAEAGLVAAGSEWPTRRPVGLGFLPLPPSFSVDQFLGHFDEDEDEIVTAKEFGRSPGLFTWLDNAGTKDSRISRADLEKGLRQLIGRGVEACPDDFLGRWDLNRDGKVDPDELPAGVRARLGPYLGAPGGGRK